MMVLLVAPQAREDLRQAYEYISQDNPSAADRVLIRIIEVCGLLASGALNGREVLLHDGRKVLTWPVPPYRIYYRKTATELQVLRVYHQARRPIER